MPKVKITGLPQMKSGGYTVKRSNARKGKTHVVIGPDGTKKYFGDPKMGEKGKSKYGKEAFYARHAKNLKGNPYFRAYARATWADGGMVDMYADGGEILKNIGAGAYGIGEGILDNITFGLTDQLTDQGYSALQELGGTNNEAQLKTQNAIRGGGNLAGQIGGAVLTGGATTGTAISGGSKGLNQIVQNTNLVSDQDKANVGMGITTAGNIGSMAMGTSPSYFNYAKKGGMINMYEGGGEVTPMYNPAVPEVSVYDLTKQAMGGYMYAQGGINNPGFRALPEAVQQKIKDNMAMGGLMYKLGGPIKAGEGYVQNEPSDGFAYGGYSYKSGSPYASSDSPVPQRTSGLMNYLGYGKPRPYAQGGKLPEPILRARLNAHMSPKEVDNYIANYANGGQTGTGILGNMTYDLKPWKYVAGGQLGPYPYPSYKSDLSEFKEGGIHIKPENRGKFTAAAKKAGMGVQEYARKVLANKENYSPTLVKRANFARNAAKWHHAYGGMQPNLPNFANGGDGDPLQYTENNPIDPGYRNNAMKLTRLLSKSGLIPKQYQQAGLNPIQTVMVESSKPEAPIKSRQMITDTGNEFYDPNAVAPVGPTSNQLRAAVENKPYGDEFRGMNISPETASKLNNMNVDNNMNVNNKSNNLYYASQYLQQAAPELSSIFGQSAEITPDYRYTPDLYYSTDARRRAGESERAAGLDLAGRTSGSQYLANRIALANKAAGLKAGIEEDIMNKNIGLRNQAALQNIAYQQYTDEANARNRAAYEMNRAKALERLGTIGATVGKDRRLEEMDRYKYGFLPYITPAMMKNPEFRKYFEKGYTT